MATHCPILLIIWRRPHTLRGVIEALRPLQPPLIYIACDGADPARPGETAKVEASRALIESAIDWPCRIEKRYSPTNQGCRAGVAAAIDWFFSEVEEGVILEDDCVPHPDFLPYCAALLERYRHDTRVFSICGSNFQEGRRHGDASYYFSIHGDSWGWASWRRAWQNYHPTEQLWPAFRDGGRLEDVFPIPFERHYWRQRLDCVLVERTINTWDYQWYLSHWMQSGLSIWPNVPLISNTGWDADGTHTFGEKPWAELATAALGPLQHPEVVLPCREADAFAFWHRREGLALLADQERRRLGWRYPWLLRWRNLKRRLRRFSAAAVAPPPGAARPHR